MKAKTIVFTLAGLLFLFGFTASAIACCDPPPCGPCSECIDDVCTWVCDIGERCCAGSCCSGTCCDGHCCPPGLSCCGRLCYDQSTQRCCIDPFYHYYICGIEQNCCGSLCYDPDVKKCCPDADPYYPCGSDETCCQGNCCEPDCEFCCDGNCCKNWQCCIDGNCVDPICDNCHTVSESVWECYHPYGAPNGAPCLTYQCIENIFITATCDYKGHDWPCTKSRCNTWYSETGGAEWAQVVHNSPCPGGIVYYYPWGQFWYGCDGCYTVGPINLACVVSSCVNNPILGSYLERPERRKQCGECGYLCE